MSNALIRGQYVRDLTELNTAVYNHLTGLVDWTGGLDWWTGLVDWTGGLTPKIIFMLFNKT